METHDGATYESRMRICREKAMNADKEVQEVHTIEQMRGGAIRAQAGNARGTPREVKSTDELTVV